MDIWAFLVASVLLTISPGPDLLYVINVSIFQHKKTAIILSFGLVSGILVHTSLVAFGVANLVKQFDWIYYGIKFFGVAYLLYLAWGTYKSREVIELKNQSSSTHTPAYKMYLRGFLMNVLNPKVTLFFMAFLPSFIAKSNWNNPQYFFILGFVFIIQALVIFYLMIQLSSPIANFIKYHPKASTALHQFKYIQIFIFVLMAILILL